MWLAADRIQPPFVNQLVLEGIGALKAEAVQRAVAAAGEANPGLRARLRGRLGWTRWSADGPEPGFREVDGARWDGNSPAGAPFLEELLDPFSGPVAEVLLVKGDQPRLVIRTHHAVTDGRGATLFAEDVFRALRGEALIGSAAGPLTDAGLARLALKALEASKAQQASPARRNRDVPDAPAPGPAPPPDRPAPTGKAHIFTPGGTWRRLRILGRFPQLLPRLLRSIGGMSPPQDPMRFGVSVDLRRFAEALPEVRDLRSTANLSGIVHIDMAAFSRGSESVDQIGGWLEEHLPDALQTPIHHDRLRWLPLRLIADAGKKAALERLRAGRYAISATLSNLGRQDMRQWQSLGFRCKRAFWIPPSSPGMPLFLTASGDDEGIDLCASMPSGLADEGRLENLLLDLRADLLVDNLRILGSRRRDL